jgi:hypothetical protein
MQVCPDCLDLVSSGEFTGGAGHVGISRLIFEAMGTIDIEQGRFDVFTVV